MSELKVALMVALTATWAVLLLGDAGNGNDAGRACPAATAAGCQVDEK